MKRKLDIIDKNNYFWSCKDVMELFLLNADPDRSHQQLSIPVRIKRPNSQPQTELRDEQNISLFTSSPICPLLSQCFDILIS